MLGSKETRLDLNHCQEDLLELKVDAELIQAGIQSACVCLRCGFEQGFPKVHVRCSKSDNACRKARQHVHTVHNQKKSNEELGTSILLSQEQINMLRIARIMFEYITYG